MTNVINDFTKLQTIAGRTFHIGGRRGAIHRVDGKVVSRHAFQWALDDARRSDLGADHYAQVRENADRPMPEGV